MAIDYALLFADAGIVAVIVLLLALISGIRQIPRIFSVQASRFIDSFLWVDSEEVVDGKKQHIKRPNPAVLAMGEAVAPIIIKAGLEWAQKNIKMGAPGGPGLPGGGGLSGIIAQSLPKGMKPFAPIIEGFAQKWLGGLGGKGEAAAAGGKGNLPPNPFLK